MQLSVSTIGKHYNRQWLFRNVSFDLKPGESMAVLGRNGSGKSTLLQIIYGLIQASEGQVTINNKSIEAPHLYFNITSPSLLLPLEFNLQEVFQYHQKMGGVLGISYQEFLALAAFGEKDGKKTLRYFSSGMLQRLKTAFCLFNSNPVKLLDEPLSNMDREGEKWYRDCIENVRKTNILIVASNSEPEYQFADQQIALAQ